MLTIFQIYLRRPVALASLAESPFTKKRYIDRHRRWISCHTPAGAARGKLGTIDRNSLPSAGAFHRWTPLCRSCVRLPASRVGQRRPATDRTHGDTAWPRCQHRPIDPRPGQRRTSDVFLRDAIVVPELPIQRQLLVSRLQVADRRREVTQQRAIQLVRGQLAKQVFRFGQGAAARLETVRKVDHAAVLEHALDLVGRPQVVRCGTRLKGEEPQRFVRRPGLEPLAYVGAIIRVHRRLDRFAVAVSVDEQELLQALGWIPEPTGDKDTFARHRQNVLDRQPEVYVGAVLHHGYETSGWIVHAAKSLVGCWSALTWAGVR